MNKSPVTVIALVSLGKQEPPYAGPALKNLPPILLSKPMPMETSSTLTPVFYYSWTTPLMTVGPDAWANKLLHVCGAQTLFYDSPVDYPQVALKDVLTRQPQALVAASKSARADLEGFWADHRSFLNAPLIVVNPDITSRFSLRLINELKLLCEGIN